MGWYQYKPYVTVAKRRAEASQYIEKMKKKGQRFDPVVIQGRAIASSFWGKAWCDNLESHRDYEYRLPRGRSYARNGSVVDLQIGGGVITAMVSGSEMYKIRVDIAPVEASRWQSICGACSGHIGSLIELLKGKFSTNVMERVCHKGEGLFPAPTEIKLSCSCPDYATMCKHVAAALYGVGARLDEKPELLFRLRNVDEKELLSKAVAAIPLVQDSVDQDKTLGGDDVNALFGLEMEATETVTNISVKTGAIKKQKKTAVKVVKITAAKTTSTIADVKKNKKQSLAAKPLKKKRVKKAVIQKLKLKTRKLPARKAVAAKL